MFAEGILKIIVKQHRSTIAKICFNLCKRTCSNL